MEGSKSAGQTAWLSSSNLTLTSLWYVAFLEVWGRKLDEVLPGGNWVSGSLQV